MPVSRNDAYSIEWRKTEAVISLVVSSLDGMELTRIQVSNRAEQATRAEPDSDGIMRGLALPPDSPLARLLLDTTEDLHKSEMRLTHQLETLMKTHPLAPWISARRGMGLKTVGRLIGTIGDPYLRSSIADDGTWVQAPRGVYQLYAYTGMHVRDDGVAPYRQKGVQSTWSERARKCLYNIAVAQRYSKLNYYRPVYDTAKAKALADVHDLLCPRCGPSGRPAQPGSPLGKAHAEGRALRAVSKQVLKEMWRHSRAMHGVLGDEDGLQDAWGPGFGDRALADAHGYPLPEPEAAEPEQPEAEAAEWLAIG
jgi:hypothetical protein